MRNCCLDDESVGAVGVGTGAGDDGDGESGVFSGLATDDTLDCRLGELGAALIVPIACDYSYRISSAYKSNIDTSLNARTGGKENKF